MEEFSKMLPVSKNAGFIFRNMQVQTISMKLRIVHQKIANMMVNPLEKVGMHILVVKVSSINIQ